MREDFFEDGALKISCHIHGLLYLGLSKAGHTGAEKEDWDPLLCLNEKCRGLRWMCAAFSVSGFAKMQIFFP